MILIVTEISTAAKNESGHAILVHVNLHSSQDASELEKNIAKVILKKINEGQDLIASCSSESSTLEGEQAIKQFGPSELSRFKRSVK